MAFGFIGKNMQNKIPQAPGLGLWDLSKYGMLKLPLRRQGAVHNGRRLAPLPEKGGDHAFYIDFPYRSKDCYAEFSGKKQEPPPWPVTVIKAFLIP